MAVTDPLIASTHLITHKQEEKNSAMVGKAAVLIGCNYAGTKAELKGCVNDVHRMRRSLIGRFGFPEANIAVLIDTDDSYTLPTGVNIRRAINRMINSATSGDELFVHYSGHGARLPAEPEEEDNTGYHECIVPCDMNLITDEDFRRFVNKLPQGCRLTIVADSCNSGGLIENAKEQIGESSIERKTNQAFVDVPAGVELHSRAGDGAIQLTGRALPISGLVELLKQNTGREEIHEGGIRSAITDVFGEAASPRTAENHRSGGLGINGEEESTGAKKQRSSSAPYGRAVLISACQSDQNAADATPVMRPEGAYGALSNAIQSILADEAKGEVLSNRELVSMAREMLAEQGFKQRPGLYCGDEVADEPFLISA